MVMEYIYIYILDLHLGVRVTGTFPKTLSKRFRFQATVRGMIYAVHTTYNIYLDSFGIYFD